MEAYENKTGGRALAIPHNGNLSNGLMFAVETMFGKPINAAYAERRMKWEPIYELTQIKGDGEAHPLLSPNDEFAGIEPGSKIRFDDKVVTDRRPGNKGDLTIHHGESTASRLAGVWARENTREALWDAMNRKEVYATTGTCILVRVFAGWDLKPDEVHRPDFAEQGYRRCVPMGGDLSAAPKGASPKFMVRALCDPDGANLDRIQNVITPGQIDSMAARFTRTWQRPIASRN